MCHWPLAACVILSLSLQLTESVEPNELNYLSEKLSRNDCWILANFLAQNSYDPIEAAAEMTKEGGRSIGFNCFPALEFWRSNLLPLTIENSKKNPTFGDEILDRGLRFIHRSDLVRGLVKIRSAKVSEAIPHEKEVFPEAVGNSLEDEVNHILINWGRVFIRQQEVNKHEVDDDVQFLVKGQEDTTPVTNHTLRQNENHQMKNTSQSHYVDQNASKRNQLVIKYGLLAIFSMIGFLMILGIILACIRARQHANARFIIQVTPVHSLPPSSLNILQGTDSTINHPKDVSLVFSDTGDSVDTNANNGSAINNNTEPGTSTHPQQTSV